jgi:hypothetical protein
MHSKTLLALTSSALALPGVIATPLAKADIPPAERVLSYRASSYKEDDLDASLLLAGSAERYDIKIHQLRYAAPVGDKHSFSLDSSYESMSGASPWYTVESVNGEAKVAMSGATIYEKRRDITAAGRRYFDNGNLGISLTISDENDYRSNSLAIDGSVTLANNSTTISGGASYSDDELSPTDALLFNRIPSATKANSSAFVSVTQILNQFSIIQSGISTARASGFLSDPYKLVDRRPEERNQFTWTTSWRRYFRPQTSALHANYRYYDDDFGVSSHTLDLSLHKTFKRMITLVPSLRYYQQDAANFFTQASDFLQATDFNSADFRLSSYGALSAGLKLNARVGKTTFVVSGERYRADASFGGAGASSPGLINFTRVSAGIDFSF